MGVAVKQWRNPHAARHAKARVGKAESQAMTYVMLIGGLSGDLPDDKKRRILAEALDDGRISEQQYASLVRECCA
jgi:hypothetical protein